MTPTRRRGAALIAAACATAPGLAQPTFYVLGGVHGSDTNRAAAMTPSGNVVVGTSTYFITWQYGFWWRPDTGIHDVGGFDPQWRETQLLGISADGRVAVGSSETAAGGPSFRPHALRAVLGSPPEDIASVAAYYSSAGAANADGSVVFGSFSETYDPPVHLFRWRSGAPSWEDLGVVPGAAFRPRATTPDGSVVVGTCLTSTMGFRWSQATGVVLIRHFPGGTRIDPLRISADGSTCYGLANTATSSIVFRQVGTGDPEQIAVLPTGFDAFDISQDGTVVVGAIANGRPGFWRSDTGPVDLLDLLHAGGVNTSSWSEWEALSTVSADGRVMSGSAMQPGTGIWDCYVVVPYGSLCYANCDGSTTLPVLNTNDFICFMGKFAAGDPGANCDNSTAIPVLNVNDFLCFQSRFVAGCS